jgi:hypothetical protein
MNKKIIITIALLMIISYGVLSSDLKLQWIHGGTTNTVSGYKISYGLSSRNYSNYITTGYVTNTTITNLPSNVPLFFSGTTLGFNDLETDFGNEIQTIMSETNKLPSAVKKFVVQKYDVWFTWTPNPTNELVTGYRIEYKKFPVVTNWTFITFVNSSTNIAIVKGIQMGYIYNFRAFAVNTFGIGTNLSNIIQIPTN